MQPTSKTILYFGNERLASGLGTDAPALRGLIDAGYTVAAVVIAQHEQAKSRQTRTLEVAEIATQHGIPVLALPSLKGAEEQLESFGAEAAVLAAYGKMVPKSIIDIFPRGIINIHPSLLPLHRGSTPIESAITDSDSETGVSLMQLVPKMDAGPVYVQAKIPLNGNETKASLAAQLNEMGAQMLLDHLPAILSGTLQPIQQDERKATTDQQLSKSDGVLDFDQPAEHLVRQVRAYGGWPRSHCHICTTPVIVTAAHAADGTGATGALWVIDKQLGFYCSEGMFVIDCLIPAGKKEMSAHDFLLGYQPS